MLFNINSDRSCDSAGRLVTAKYLRVMAVGDTDMHIIEDVCICRSSIEHTTFFHAIEGSIRLGIDICRFTTCSSLFDD